MAKKVFIDAGHGGADSGAYCFGHKESDIVLNVSIFLKNILLKNGFDVKTTRENDVFLSLLERAKIANEWRADLFLSIHCNSAYNERATGFETFIYPYSKRARPFAEKIQEEYIKSFHKVKDRGVKTARFSVLRNTKMPAVLIECEFMSNEHVLTHFLLKRQEDIAKAIAKGLIQPDEKLLV